MQEKQKVTLYLPPGLHRQLKVKAAIETDSMSALVERAIDFYLRHPEQVEEVEASYGRTHQVHVCPECQAAMVMRDGKMISLKNQPSVINDEFSDEFSMVGEAVRNQTDSHEQEELVPC
jgi:hypothetical protein